MSYINYNGKIFPADSAIFPLNRAINYGDGMFEGIRICNGEILFFNDHIERMFRAMNSLKIEMPENFSPPFLHKQIIDLGIKEKIKDNARVRIGIFRSGSGLYEPEKNAAEYFIEIIAMEKGYEWSNSTCSVGVFRDVIKNYSAISFFKSMNSLAYVMASIYKKENHLGDCFLLNSSGMVTEATSSNIFWIEKGKIFSPPITDGGVEGVMRKNLIRLLNENNFSFQEKSIPPDQLKFADEIFLTNVGWGIKPVTEFESVFYQTKITVQIFKMILQ